MARKTTSTTNTTTNKNQATKTMKAVASSIDFIKSQIANDLMTAKSQGLIELDNRDLQRVTNLVQASITQSFVKTSDQITTSFEN